MQYVLNVKMFHVSKNQKTIQRSAAKNKLMNLTTY